MLQASMTIEKYLKRHKLSRGQFLDLLAAHNWRPNKGTVSRWISGKRSPTPAARALLEKISGGEIKY